LVFLTSWVDRVEFLLPIVNVSLLSFLGLHCQISLPFSLLFLHGSLAFLEGCSVLLGETFELPSFIKFYQINSLKDVVHFLLVYLSIGVVPFFELLDILRYGCDVFIFLVKAIPTIEVILLIYTFLRIISSVILLCLEMESFSFCNWFLRRPTLLRMTSRSFWICLNSSRLIAAS